MTAAWRVSMESRSPGCSPRRRARRSRTGSTRPISVAASTAVAPGRVNSPPMSRIEAPALHLIQREGDGGLGVDMLAAVGEAVGRHIDDTHEGGGFVDAGTGPAQQIEARLETLAEIGTCFQRPLLGFGQGRYEAARFTGGSGHDLASGKGQGAAGQGARLASRDHGRCGLALQQAQRSDVK